MKVATWHNHIYIVFSPMQHLSFFIQFNSKHMYKLLPNRSMNYMNTGPLFRQLLQPQRLANSYTCTTYVITTPVTTISTVFYHIRLGWCTLLLPGLGCEGKGFNEFKIHLTYPVPKPNIYFYWKVQQCYLLHKYITVVSFKLNNKK